MLLHKIKPLKFSLYLALAATVIGLITVVLNWHLFDYWGGPIIGYKLLLFPGNMSLVYFWHPVFTEEVDLLPKVAMVLFGQFSLVFAATFVFSKLTLLLTRYLIKRNI